MRWIRRIAFALLLAAPVLAPPASAGAERPPATPGEALDRALERAAAALRAMLDAIPRYAPPEIRENGDIVIRRLPPPRREPRPAPPSLPEPT